ncbi:MAG: DUF2087 domain-containing protein [Clostridiales bacterium]|nr:DUF2087 domain-containing protein [Clostridiales bacterium]
MDYGKLTLTELKQGYRRDEQGGAYVCNVCGERFTDGQVYPVDGKYFTPEHAAKRHVFGAHGGGAAVLIHSDTKYNSLTENQKDLLSRFAAGESDRQIAKALSISEATVRRQRFNFREKAKQAKHYLAVYERVFETEGKDTLMPIHDKAVFLDDRYVITETERARILKNAFASLNPPVLKAFPPKEKKKVVILTLIAAQFEKGRRYTEQEVNHIIKPIYDDYVTIRRFLIIYGLMSRTRSGSEYWLTE